MTSRFDQRKFIRGFFKAFSSKLLMRPYDGVSCAISQPMNPLSPAIEYEDAIANDCYHQFDHAASPIYTSHSYIVDGNDPNVMNDRDSAIAITSSKPSSLRHLASARFNKYLSSSADYHALNMNKSSTNVRASYGSDCPPFKRIGRSEMLEALRDFDMFPPVPRGDHSSDDDRITKPHVDSCTPFLDRPLTPSGRKRSYSIFPKSSQTDTLPLRCRTPELIALSRRARIATSEQLRDLWQTTRGEVSARHPPGCGDDLVQLRVTR